MSRLTPPSIAIIALSLLGCSSQPVNATDASAPRDAAADLPAQDSGPRYSTAPPSSPDCDPLMESHCTFPWPSNLYLQPDTTRRTGFTLTFGPGSLPRNFNDEPFEPAPYRRMDGYSVGSPLMVAWRDLDASRFAPESDIARSLAPDADILWFEVDGTTLRRVPYFTELDTVENAEDPTMRVLFVRPAVILKEGTRYIAAFRNLRDRRGAAIPPSAAFMRLRDGSTDGDARLAPRQARFTDIFTRLEAAGVSRASLTLAWDFVTASDQSLHGRMLQMRDDAFAMVGPQGPAMTVTEVTRYVRTEDGSGREVNPDIAFELHGTFRVPDFMRPERRGSFFGSVFNLDPSGRVVPVGMRDPSFWIRVPWSALDGTPHGLFMHGHGLLGEGDQVRAGFLDHLANTEHFITYAASLTGMSSSDFASVLGTVQNLSNFTWMADRLHQGMIEWLLLTRAMRERFASLPEVSRQNVHINREENYYTGISQGGIFGGTYMALSQDVTRGHLGVPGNNYSLLLQRSVDFDSYLNGIRMAYPNTIDQDVLLATVQLLWEGSEPISYLRHIHDAPFANTPVHDVLLGPAKGDHQVAVVSNEIAARTDIGIRLMDHYDHQRTPFGITQQTYPYRGSGIVLWDFGNPWPAAGNIGPRDGRDPHGSPRVSDAHNRQMLHFLRTGEIIDVCGGDGCHPD